MLSQLFTNSHLHPQKLLLCQEPLPRVRRKGDYEEIVAKKSVDSSKEKVGLYQNEERTNSCTSQLPCAPGNAQELDGAYFGGTLLINAIGRRHGVAMLIP